MEGEISNSMKLEAMMKMECASQTRTTYERNCARIICDCGLSSNLPTSRHKCLNEILAPRWICDDSLCQSEIELGVLSLLVVKNQSNSWSRHRSSNSEVRIQDAKLIKRRDLVRRAAARYLNASRSTFSDVISSGDWATHWPAKLESYHHVRLQLLK